MGNEAKEQLRPRVSTDAKKAPEKSLKDKETGRKAAEILKSEGVEANEGQEGTEAMGKVGEEASEDKRYAPYTGSGAGYSADQIEIIRAKLLAALPSMITQYIRLRFLPKLLLQLCVPLG